MCLPLNCLEILTGEMVMVISLVLLQRMSMSRVGLIVVSRYTMYFIRSKTWRRDKCVIFFLQIGGTYTKPMLLPPEVAIGGLGKLQVKHRDCQP